MTTQEPQSTRYQHLYQDAVRMIQDLSQHHGVSVDKLMETLAQDIKTAESLHISTEDFYSLMIEVPVVVASGMRALTVDSDLSVDDTTAEYDPNSWGPDAPCSDVVNAKCINLLIPDSTSYDDIKPALKALKKHLKNRPYDVNGQRRFGEVKTADFDDDLPF